ncbi:MAG: hypothetical protein ACFFFH_19760 [Candidatus Thorarchaeota archaeon]
MEPKKIMNDSLTIKNDAVILVHEEKQVPLFIKRIIFFLLFLIMFLFLVLLPPFFQDFFGIEVPWYIIILIWITGIPFKIILREILEPIFLTKFRHKIRTKFLELKIRG